MTNPFLKDTDINTPVKGLTLSDTAVKRLTAILAGEATPSVLRVTVQGGGCSGFQYTFNIDVQTDSNDYTITQECVTVVCDRQSLSYIDGGVIDFVDSLAGAYFTIHNPNATANCGCGTSFSI